MKLLKLIMLGCFAAAFVLPAIFTRTATQAATEAPAGFDNLTNTFLSQTDFDAALAVFEERDDIAKGLGPVYNTQSCAECHQNPITGGISQVTEMRAGHTDANGNFVDAAGGGLIHQRATHTHKHERASPTPPTPRALRTSPETVG